MKKNRQSFALVLSIKATSLVGNNPTRFRHDFYGDTKIYAYGLCFFGAAATTRANVVKHFGQRSPTGRGVYRIAVGHANTKLGDGDNHRRPQRQTKERRNNENRA